MPTLTETIETLEEMLKAYSYKSSHVDFTKHYPKENEALVRVIALLKALPSEEEIGEMLYKYLSEIQRNHYDFEGEITREHSIVMYKRITEGK